ncbi:BQ2448_5056 [Microbotryum intermedium]|uniref:BQ2448_5056 protein n=1 Tax=Microbotryum intermedium TaxID=269621 RepID=A0A238F352_9BASI|nr:BQ2448_5056 [Microbotryum intermedium]
MYEKLGVPGTSSLHGGLAVLFMPVPFLLFKYGKKVRMMRVEKTFVMIYI